MTNDPYELFTAAIKTASTRKTYDWALEQFLAYCKADEYSDLLKGELAEIEEKVLSYILYLNNEKFSNSMRNIRIAAIKLFYEMNNKTLGWKRLLKAKRDSTKPQDDRPYTKDEIIKMLRATDSPRDRAIILILATSGMRIGALPEVRMADLQLLPEQKALAIRVYAGQHEQYTAFITPEATKQVFEYLRTRYKKIADIPKDHYLITNAHYPEHQTSIESLSNTVRDLAVKAGVRSEDGDKFTRKDVPLNHGFRKFTNTVFVRSEGLKTIFADMLLGHNIGVQGHYLQPSTTELFEEYRRAIPALTFHFQNSLVQTP